MVIYPWKANAIYVERECGSFVNYDEEFYLCPECGEPVYSCDWSAGELLDYVCPICGWEGD